MTKKISDTRISNSMPYSEFRQMPKIEKDNFSVFDVENDLEKSEYKKIDYKNEPKKEDIKNIRCGSTQKFESYLKAYEDSKSDFTVVSYGATKKIIYGKSSYLFNGLKGEKKPKGLHLISLVKKDIDNLIGTYYDEKTDTNIPINPNFKIPNIPEKKPYLTFVHHKNLDWYGTGIEALAIDINHCYWRTAYLLKFITEETYLKGLERTEYKDGRLIAIGTLGKILTVKKYKGGVKIAEYVDDRDYIKYGGFFWAVITKVYNLLIDLWQNLKEDFLMFLTDCVVIDPSKRDDAVAIMEKHGYGTKEYKLVFTEMTESKVEWLTDKGDFKHITHNRLLSKEPKSNN